MEYPYTLINKGVELIDDDLERIIRDDTPYNSLNLLYQNYCQYIPYMEFDDNGMQIIIWIDSLSNTYQIHRSSNNDSVKSTKVFQSIEETGEFANCYIELQNMASVERKKVDDILNDSRNFQQRVSARIIDNDLHVFSETYNYSLPKSGEYYFMDYCNGEYTLYITPKSRFMKMYYSEEKYKEIYGDLDDIIKGKFNSVEEIEEILYSIPDTSVETKVVLELYINAFETLKSEIDMLIDMLQDGTAHINNLGLYDSKYDIIEHYKAEAEFECISVPFKSLKENEDVEIITQDKICSHFNYLDNNVSHKKEENHNNDDTEMKEKKYQRAIILFEGTAEDLKVIVGISNENPEFTLSDGRKVKLTLNDLYIGDKLGLRTIDEIGALLLKHGGLKIKDLL